MPLAQALAKTAASPAKNNSGSSVTNGDVVMFQLDGTDDGFDLISPVLLAAQPENLFMGVGAVEAPSGMSIGNTEFCMMRRSGPGKVRVNGSGTAIAIGDLLYPQQGLFLAVTKAAQPDVVGGDGSIVSASAVAGASSTAAVAFDRSLTIPANALQAGDVVRIRAQGLVVDQNGSDTATIRLRLGGSTLATSPAIDVADNDVFNIDSAVTIRTDGASGTLVASSLGQGPDAAGTDLAVWGDILASTAVNTTAAITVDATVQFSGSHADNQVRLDTLVVEVMRPNRGQTSQQAFAVAQEATTSADAVINAYFLGR
jgi:hypothetical protein